ncbi:MAG: type IV secretory system conjugative DNA transfer family protein [Eggerthellaceae bacterium]|nr:type IV secretory system conjugative DNA transfer family protein [Eggerthellaceae bacterium]
MELGDGDCSELSGKPEESPPSSLLNGCSSGISLGIQLFGGPNAVFLPTVDRFRHIYVVGPSGEGKTTFLVGMALQDINQGRPFAFFDPGNAVDQIIRCAPREHLENVVLIDFNNPACKVRLNLFDIDISDKAAVDRACEDAIYLLRGNVPFAWAGARFEQKVRAASMTILDEGFPDPRSVLCVGKLILDDVYRKRILRHVRSDYVRRAWLAEDKAAMSLEHGEVNQWVYSKFDIFDTNDALQQIFGPGESTVDVERIMAEGKTLLAKIDESVVGTQVASMITRFFVAQEQRSVMRRRLYDPGAVQPYFLYFDEFQRFVSTSFAELLSESRKYQVGLVLANQNLRQLVQYNRQEEEVSSEVMESVLANAGNLVAFRPSAWDAKTLAPEFDVKPKDLRQVPQYAASVRLLSHTRTEKPLVVSMPLPKGPFDDGNAEWLADRMLEEGIWMSPDDGEGKRPDTDGRKAGWFSRWTAKGALQGGLEESPPQEEPQSCNQPIAEGADGDVGVMKREGWFVKLGRWVREKGLSAWYFPVIAFVLVLMGDIGILADYNISSFDSGDLMVLLVFGGSCIAAMLFVWQVVTTEMLYRYKLFFWGATVLCIAYVFYRGTYGFMLGLVYATVGDVVFLAVFSLALFIAVCRGRFMGYVGAAALCLVVLVVLVWWQVSPFMTLVVAYVMAAMVAQAFLECLFPGIASGARFAIALVASLVVIAAVVFFGFPWGSSFMRMMSFITTGKSDPYNTGWEYLQVDKLFAGSQLIGASDTLMYHNYDALTPRGWWGSFPILNTIVIAGRLPGLALALLCLCLVTLLVHAAIKSSPKNRPIVTALAGMIAVQMTVTVLMNFNLFPLNSLSVPFLGQGYLSLMMSCLALGTIAALRREELEVKLE